MSFVCFLSQIVRPWHFPRWPCWPGRMCLLVRRVYVLDISVALLISDSLSFICWRIHSMYVLHIFVALLILDSLSFICWRFTGCTSLTLSSLCWSQTHWLSSAGPFTVCTFLTFSSLCRSQTHWVSSVGTFAGSTCLIFYLLGWLHSEWVSCIGTLAASAYLAFFSALILTKFHVLACSDCMSLKCSLLSILTGFHVFAYSQAVRAWHFPYSVDLKRLASFMCLLVHRWYVDVISLLVWCHADRFLCFLFVRSRYVLPIFFNLWPSFICWRGRWCE